MGGRGGKGGGTGDPELANQDRQGGGQYPGWGGVGPDDESKQMETAEIDVQAGLDQVIQIIPVIIITEPPPEQTEIMKITEPHRSTSATQIEASTLVQYLETEKMNITEP